MINEKIETTKQRRDAAKDIASRLGFALGCEAIVQRRSRGDSGISIHLKLEDWLEINRTVGDEELAKWGLMDDLEKAFQIKQAVENLKTKRLKAEESLARLMT